MTISRKDLIAVTLLSCEGVDTYGIENEVAETIDIALDNRDYIGKQTTDQSVQDAALQLAAQRFREYEKLHAAKPDMEKARRNAEMAEICENALKSQPAPSPWRPIDDDARSGAPILATNRTIKEFSCSVYFDNEALTPDYPWCICDTEIYCHKDRFTDYMPLPPPPAGVK